MSNVTEAFIDEMYSIITFRFNEDVDATREVFHRYIQAAKAEAREEGHDAGYKLGFDQASASAENSGYGT